MIHFDGRLLSDNQCRFIGYGQPFVAYGLNEIRLNCTQFMFRATLSLQLVFVDSRIYNLLGYGAGNVLDRSFYGLVHADDVEVVKTAHRIGKSSF